ncbi:MAG: LysR family transcriptional regulator [Bdellovibrionales bacterium]|nr:LysR family transcriptional regulator [Bdellovibrionales bacterium]
MDTLHWPLTVLSKAVHFKNLTGASTHVGLSQPQMSRLIAQLEKEFDVTLLDRSAKRKSAWTPAAHKLAEVYTQNARKLQGSIEEALGAEVPSQVNIGTLEGLKDLALNVAHSLLEHSKITTVELDVFDSNELEEKFINGDLDLIFTSHEPGKQKFKHLIEVGYQTLNEVDSNKDFSVMSPFEYGRLKKKPTNKIFISNSLSIRKHWLDSYGGKGTVPSVVKKTKGRDPSPVFIIGGELFSENIWRQIASAAKELI